MAEVYIVLTAQVEGTPETGYDIYHYWDGSHFTDKALAVSHGFEIRESDDFNIGVVVKGKLASVWWMDEQIDEEASVLAGITEACDLGRLRDAS
jgi:hypothetical protein